MEVVVEVGGWEHACCGPAVERHEVVDFSCTRAAHRDGRPYFICTHHDVEPVERVRGWVVDICVLLDAGARPVRRVPSGRALRGFDPNDDGHLEDPWTNDVFTSSGGDFLVSVRLLSADVTSLESATQR